MKASKCIAMLLIAGQMSFCLPVLAQGTPPAADAVKATKIETAKPNPLKGALPIKKGAPASVDGVLLPAEIVARVIAELQSAPEKIAIEVERAVGNNKAKCDYDVKSCSIGAASDKKVYEAQLADAKRQQDALIKQVEAEQARRGDPMLWLGLGFVGGMVISFVSVFLATRAVK